MQYFYEFYESISLFNFLLGNAHIRDYLPVVFCHTQHVGMFYALKNITLGPHFIWFLFKRFFSFITERAVANTTFASKMVVGYKNRHGFLISMANSRKRLGKNTTKGDFQLMMAEHENMSDDE